MTPEEDPLVAFDLEGEEPVVAGRDEQEPIVVDLDEAVFEILQQVDTSGDPSAWIRAAVREKAQREDPGGDIADRLYELHDEMVRLVKLEQEFGEAAALDSLRELTARLRDTEAAIETLGRIIDRKPADEAGKEL